MWDWRNRQIRLSFPGQEAARVLFSRNGATFISASRNWFEFKSCSAAPSSVERSLAEAYTRDVLSRADVAGSGDAATMWIKNDATMPLVLRSAAEAIVVDLAKAQKSQTAQRTVSEVKDYLVRRVADICSGEEGYVGRFAPSAILVQQVLEHRDTLKGDVMADAVKYAAGYGRVCGPRSALNAIAWNIVKKPATMERLINYKSALLDEEDYLIARAGFKTCLQGFQAGRRRMVVFYNRLSTITMQAA